MTMIQIGSKYTLPVIEIRDAGAYLDAEELGPVLLPRRYLPRGLKSADQVEAFLYHDSDGRAVATTKMPAAMVGQFACLPVADVNQVGAFLDWGLEKDLMVPFAEQHRPMEKGHSYLVYLFLDRIYGRITASSKIDKFLDEDREHTFKPGQPVDLIIASSTELGFKAIINHSHWGVLYKNDVHRRLSFGQSVTGFIRHIRADGRIDLTLQPTETRRQQVDKHAAAIEHYLRNHQGFAPVHDRSAPAEIAELFGMSKAVFKRTIGRLYKLGIIEIRRDGISLVEPDQNKPVRDE